MESPSGARNGWPRGWAEYVAHQQSNGQPIAPELAVWSARFRAARLFSGVSFDGMSEKGSEGYFVGLKLSLVESALETYEQARNMPVGSLGFTEPDISFSLWEERLSELNNALRRLENPRLQRSFQAFILADKESCQDFDLRVLLRAFRHLTAHGFFNPSSADLYTSSRYRNLLLGIASAALEACETHFFDRELSAVGEPVESDTRAGGPELAQDVKEIRDRALRVRAALQPIVDEMDGRLVFVRKDWYLALVTDELDDPGSLYFEYNIDRCESPLLGDLRDAKHWDTGTLPEFIPVEEYPAYETPEQIRELYEQDVGDLSPEQSLRVVKFWIEITLEVDLPEGISLEEAGESLIVEDSFGIDAGLAQISEASAFGSSHAQVMEMLEAEEADIS